MWLCLLLGLGLPEQARGWFSPCACDWDEPINIIMDTSPTRGICITHNASILATTMQWTRNN